VRTHVSTTNRPSGPCKSSNVFGSESTPYARARASRVEDVEAGRRKARAARRAAAASIEVVGECGGARARFLCVTTDVGVYLVSISSISSSVLPRVSMTVK